MTCKINADTTDGLKITSDTSGNVDIQNNGTTKAAFTANSLVLSGAGTETKSLEIGSGRSGDGTTHIDLTGDATYTDFGTRLIRNAGANAATELVHRGTGILALIAQDAGRIEFKVANIEKMRIDADGVTVTDADNSQPRLLLKNTNADTSSAFLDFQKDSASPANDNLGIMRWIGDDSAGNTVAYATIVGSSPVVTDGSEDGRLSFQTYVDGTNAERMAINADGSTHLVNARIGGSGTVSSTGSWTGSGDVVLHTTSPSLNLGAFGVVVSHTYRGVFFTNSLWNVYDESNVGVHLVGGNTSWTANSDERIKENITELNGSDAYNHVKAARAVTFNWKQEAHNAKAGTKIGFIAQDWETNYPELIEESVASPQLAEEIDGIEDDTQIKGMQYTETVPVLMAALKEAIAKIEVLETKVAALESE